MKQMCDIDVIRGFIRRCQWVWAKTYRNIPHEYIVRNRCALNDDEFLYFVHAQRSMGIHERWGRYNFPYLYVDGYKYWTMGDTYENTIIINRQKIFGEIDALGITPHPYYTEAEYQRMVSAVRNISDGTVLDIGCGDAPYLDNIAQDENSYLGIEASKVMVEQFKAKHPSFAGAVKHSAFEECSKKIEQFDIVVALFGSASYIMRPYLSIINRDAKDYFLMFYQDGFCPESYRTCHHFSYSASDVRQMFPHGYLYDGENYRICSSKEIDWKQIVK